MSVIYGIKSTAMKQHSKWAILGGVILAMLLSSLDQTIVSTAMPKIVMKNSLM